MSYDAVVVGGALDAVAARVRQVQAMAAEPMAKAEEFGDLGSNASARVRFWPTAPAGPRAVLQLQPPAGNPSDAQPLFTYFPNQVGTTGLGIGWDDAYRRRVQTVSGTAADVITGRAATRSYTGLDANNNYVPPGDSDNTLHKETSGWTETQPDGAAFRYDTGGRLQRLTSPAGQRTTMLYDGGGKMTAIQSPTGSRVTYAYDTFNNIKRVQDSAGRITTLTVPAGVLTRMITPDGQRTTMGYDAGNFLRRTVNPAGQITTLAFQAGTPIIRRRQLPTSQITTYMTSTVGMPAAARIATVDPQSQRTTVAFDTSGNVTSVTNPLSQRTSMTYTGGNRLQSVRLPSGARTSMAYATTSTNAARLQSEIAGCQERMALPVILAPAGAHHER